MLVGARRPPLPAVLLCLHLTAQSLVLVKGAECAERGSLAKCEPCLTSSQCKAGLNCSLHLKACVGTEYDSCSSTNAGCEHGCDDGDDPADCKCSDPFFPALWPADCASKEVTSANGSASPSHEEDDKARPVCTGDEEDTWTQDFCGSSDECCASWWLQKWGAHGNCSLCLGKKGWGQKHCPGTCCQHCQDTSKKKAAPEKTPAAEELGAASQQDFATCKDGQWQMGMLMGALTSFVGQVSDPDKCIAMVRDECPTAVGASMRLSAHGSCWCVFGKGSLSGKQWTFCEFKAPKQTSTTATTTTTLGTTTMKESHECMELGLADTYSPTGAGNPKEACSTWWFDPNGGAESCDKCRDVSDNWGRKKCAGLCCTKCGLPASMVESAREIEAPQCAADEDTWEGDGSSSCSNPDSCCMDWWSKHGDCTTCANNKTTWYKKCASTCCMQCKSARVLEPTCSDKENRLETTSGSPDQACNDWWLQNVVNDSFTACDACGKEEWGNEKCAKVCCEKCKRAPKCHKDTKDLWTQDWCSDPEKCCSTWWSATWGAQQSCKRCAGTHSWGQIHCPGKCCTKCQPIEVPEAQLAYGLGSFQDVGGGAAWPTTTAPWLRLLTPAAGGALVVLAAIAGGAFTVRKMAEKREIQLVRNQVAADGMLLTVRRGYEESGRELASDF